MTRPHNEIAIAQRKGWAWLIGIVPLASLSKFARGLSTDQVEVARQKGLSKTDLKTISSTRDRELHRQYEIVRCLFLDLNQCAMTSVRIPKTLSAFRREENATSRIERDYYREFLLSGASVAETLVFAARLGIWQFVTEQGPNEAKGLLLEQYKEGAERAALDFRALEPILTKYFDGKISGKDMVDEATSSFFALISPDKGTRQKLWDALQLTPNFWGIGVDLKKL